MTDNNSNAHHEYEPSDPKGYFQESHEMESEFISIQEKCPSSTDGLTIFKFDRRQSTFDLDSFSTSEFRKRISQEDIEEVIKALYILEDFDYQKLFRNSSKYLFWSFVIPFTISIIVIQIFMRASMSVGACLAAIFFSYLFFTGISVCCIHCIIKGFREKLSMRCRNIQSVIDQQSSYLRQKGQTQRCGPMAAWIELYDDKKG